MMRTWLAIILGAIFLFLGATAHTATPSDNRRRVDYIMKCAISTPKPEYPYNARFYWMEGHGMFLVRVKISTGQVKDVRVLTTTGHQSLDQAAVAGLSRWRFKPGALPSIRELAPKRKDPFANEDCLMKIPVNFTMDRRHHKQTGVIIVPTTAH